MGWGPGLAKGDQNFQNMHRDVTYRKPPPKTKNVFFMSTRRLAESVEGLNSSLALAACNLWPNWAGQSRSLKG